MTKSVTTGYNKLWYPEVRGKSKNDLQKPNYVQYLMDMLFEKQKRHQRTKVRDKTPTLKIAKYCNNYCTGESIAILIAMKQNYYNHWNHPCIW